MFIAKLGSLAGLAQGSLATGTDVQANAYTVDDDALLVHVRAEIPACAALGETHIISERLGLATDITLPGHGQLPSNIYLNATTQGSNAGSAGGARNSQYHCMGTGAPKDRRTRGNTTLNPSILAREYPNTRSDASYHFRL